MNDSIKICAVGVVCAVLCVLIKNMRSEFIIPARLAGTVVVFSFVLVLLEPILKYLNDMMGQALPIEYMEILVKALSVAYVTQISSDICRDCGEGNIAFAIETAGKFEIIILSFPLINQIIETSGEMIL